jgi:hypothetical protein
MEVVAVGTLPTLLLLRLLLPCLRMIFGAFIGDEDGELVPLLEPVTVVELADASNGLLIDKLCVDDDADTAGVMIGPVTVPVVLFNGGVINRTGINGC